MKVFLSYASEDKGVAERIAFSLRARKHTVFLDQDDLPAGGEYDLRIEKAVQASDLMIFLITPASVARGRYTMSELEFARRKWRKPDGHILPVMIADTPIASLPGFLGSVSILEPKGNVAAEVAVAAEAMRGDADYRNSLIFGGLGLLSGLATPSIGQLMNSLPSIGQLNFTLGGIGFSIALLAGLHYTFGLRLRHGLIIIFSLLAFNAAVNVCIAMGADKPEGRSILDLEGVEVSDDPCTLFESETDEAKKPDLERQCLRQQLDTANQSNSGRKSFEKSVLGFGLAGAVGAFLTLLGMGLTVGRPVSNYDFIIVTAVGTAAAALYVAIGWNHDTLSSEYLLYAPWQAAVAAFIGRAVK